MTRENITMKKHQILRFCALSLGIILFCAQLAYAQSRSIPVAVPTTSSQTVLQQLATANVVYLGETHANPDAHLAELQIIEELHRQNPNLAIAMEMFQRPFQVYLNRYLGNDLMEMRLRELTQYKERWGYPWEYYAPFLRFAKANRLPVLAIDIPTEISRKVARRGLESLSRFERQYVAPLSEIQTDNAAYRQLMLEIFNRTPSTRRRTNDFERYFQSQLAQNETMAETIAKFLQDNADFQVVVITDRNRILYGYGIPSGVAKRLGSANLVQRTVSIDPPPDIEITADRPIADFIWRTSQTENRG